MATRAEIIDAIQAGRNRVTATFSKLSEDQLQSKIHEGSDGWNARQILAHLANRQPTYDMLVSIAVDGNGTPPGGFSIDDWNQKLVEERAGRTREELLEEFQQVHDHLIERARKLRDDQLSFPVILPNRETNLGNVLLGSGGMHSIQHASEVEEALGIDPDE